MTEIYLAQFNPKVGDIIGNARKIKELRDKCPASSLLVTSELGLCGYPPEDLVLKPEFQEKMVAAVGELTESTRDGGAGILLGVPWQQEGKLYNAAILLDQGKISGISFKHHLPNYGVFDEMRIFAAGPMPGPLSFRGLKLGILICEDMWHNDVAFNLWEKGADILVAINGSPFETGKSGLRLKHAQSCATLAGLPLLYVNQVGGQDELVFDGRSFVIDKAGKTLIQAAAWEEKLIPVRLEKREGEWIVSNAPSHASALLELEETYQALTLGLRDYVLKNNFPGIIIGLSGGIDSALTAAIAVDAIGADKVRTVMMPSPYTAQISLDDAKECAELLGCRYDIIPIEPLMQAYNQSLAPIFADLPPDITEENLQARIRGVLLMAMSNKFGPLLVSTGNKSEMSAGYSTLYGDMCGGFALLKDVYKVTIFQLCHWRNAKGRVIPERIITRPPSAELKPDQTDQDTLPPYEVLDAILSELIEKETPLAQIVAMGHSEALVKRVWTMLDRAEYKRRQAPPGVKITPRAFGRDRRYPITNGFKG